MLRSNVLAVIAAALFAAAGLAADPPALLTAQGTVDKVDKDTLTVRPRGPDGRFEKAVVLRVTGTSKITTLSPQMRSGKLVVTQKDTDVKDLKAKQTIAVIYCEAPTPVLLSAVAHPPGDK
jgi:hypothetical protein